MLISCILWCFDIIRNHSGCRETAPPWFSWFLETAKGPAWSMTLICKITFPEPYLFYLVHIQSTPEAIFLSFNHPRTRCQELGITLQVRAHRHYSSLPVLNCLPCPALPFAWSPQQSSLSASPTPTPVFFLLTTLFFPIGLAWCASCLEDLWV